jgi:pentose-5-phosphate-3-epimerase
VVEAGARVLVAGSAVYNHNDYAASIAAIRSDGMHGLERAQAT